MDNVGVGHRYELNSDVGEGFPYDDALMARRRRGQRRLRVPCRGRGHDAPPVQLAAERGVQVGAQVSYRDREGFGRRDLDVPADQLTADLVQQVEALQNAAASHGGRCHLPEAARRALQPGRLG